VTFRFDAPGGVETNVREVARRLRAAGEEVEVFSGDLYDEARWERRTEFPTEVDGTPVRWFPVRKRLVPGLTLPVMVGLLDALRESGADVIHAHSHRYGHVLQSAAVARACGIPLVVSTHYHPSSRTEPLWSQAMLRAEDLLFGMTAYRVARRLIVESEIEARFVRDFAPAERVAVVPPGIDLAAWADPASDHGSAPPLPPGYILFAGRIAPNKGLATLLDAMAMLPSDARPPLVLMGKDWGARTQVEGIAHRLRLDETLRWLSYVPDPRAWREVFRGARALVLPSEWEAYGLVLLEAMAAGTPIVATAVGGVPEVLAGGSAGRLVPYGEPAALAQAILETLENAAATRALVARATERVRTLDWSRSVERLRKIYREVTADRADPTAS
jgi:glycosyltransferase involved in cell wall biosynthesis